MAAFDPTFQHIILALHRFWSDRGCVIEEPYDLELGAGTMAPHTFLRVLGPQPWRVGYVQPSRRPDDGRYADNPYRLYRHYQYQVILKPSPPDVQAVYVESLESLGIKRREHDIRFNEDDWEAPTLGASGIGWQVWLDGLEITQFTYFQSAGGMELWPVSVELTYGLERIAMFLQGVDDFKDIVWARQPDGGVTKYGDLYAEFERQFSRYNYELADVEQLTRAFDDCEAEALRLLALDDPLPLPAYDLTLRCSHLFNVLDARGAVSVSERTTYIGRVRKLASRVARTHLAAQEPGRRDGGEAVKA